MDAIRDFCNYVRDASLPEDQREQRRVAKDVLEVIQRVTVITMIACAAIFLLVPKVWTFLILGAVSYLAFETGLVARNFREILADARIEGLARASRDARIEQLGKEAPLARFVFRITLPE